MRWRILIAVTFAVGGCDPGDPPTGPPGETWRSDAGRSVDLRDDAPGVQLAGNSTLVCTFTVGRVLQCTASDPDRIEIVEVIASTQPVVLEQRIVPKPACPLSVVFRIQEGFPMPHRHVVTVIDCQRRTGRDDFTINREGGVRRVSPR